jgi:uncharacterized membrane protein YkvA (DUF1232 family)
MVITIDEGRMVGVMMSSLVRRLRDRGWEKENAERIADKAISKCKKLMRPLTKRLTEELEAAHSEGASEDVLQLLVTSAYAVAGVDIADDLTRTSIAERN